MTGSWVFLHVAEDLLDTGVAHDHLDLGVSHGVLHSFLIVATGGVHVVLDGVHRLREASLDLSVVGFECKCFRPRLLRLMELFQ